MKPPIILADDRTERNPVITDETFHHLISQESFLRRSAYKNTSIITDESFFNDSDMKSEYYLIIVYDKISAIPLLSARYYSNRLVIAKCLEGDPLMESRQIALRETLDLNAFKEEGLFLADRLSGNVHSSIYRQYRTQIFSLFYSEILTHNNGRKLVLMARKEKQEKLLNKYLHLGFSIVGITIHRGKEHWIISADLKNA